LRALLLMELISRVCKNTLRELLRRSASSENNAEGIDPKLRDNGVVVKFYNLLFSTPPARKRKEVIPTEEVTPANVKEFWMKKIKEGMQHRYADSLTKEEMKKKFDLRKSPFFDFIWLWDRLDKVNVNLALLLSLSISLLLHSRSRSSFTRALPSPSHFHFHFTHIPLPHSRSHSHSLLKVCGTKWIGKDQLQQEVVVAKGRSIALKDMDEQEVVISRIYTVPFFEAYVLWHRGKRILLDSSSNQQDSLQEGLQLFAEAAENGLEALEVSTTPPLPLPSAAILLTQRHRLGHRISWC